MSAKAVLDSYVNRNSNPPSGVCTCVTIPAHSRFALLLSLFVSLASANSAVQQTYFPEKAFGDGPLLYEWYSHVLKVLEEPSLLEEAHDPSFESYRFLWLRTHHHPVSVRLDVNADGTSVVTAKVGNGAAGFPYTIKRVEQNVSRPLARERTQAFLARAVKVGFWSVPSYIKEDRTGDDGSDWIVEAVKEGKYHVATRWSPGSDAPPMKRAVRDLGLTLLTDIAQLKIPADEIY